MKSEDPLLGDEGTMRNGGILLLVEQLGSVLTPLQELTKLLIRGGPLLVAESERETGTERGTEADTKAEAAALALLTVHIFLIILTAATPFDTLRAACISDDRETVRRQTEGEID